VEFLYFLARRLLWSVLVLVGLSIIIFIIARVVPGDPARIALGPLATAEQVAELQSEMGLDRSIPSQYLGYVGGLLQGDLGRSLLTQRSVNRDIGDTFSATFELGYGGPQ
jgi:peptide/nickel transport system permease protein